MSRAVVPERVRSPPVDLFRPCAKCRWSHDNLMGRIERFFGGSPLDTRCRHPVVNAELPNATRQGWLIGEYSDGGPIHRADPVTGTPGWVDVGCSLVRSWPYLLEGRERPIANCGPDGRYWEAK